MNSQNLISPRSKKRIFVKHESETKFKDQETKKLEELKEKVLFTLEKFLRKFDFEETILKEKNSKIPKKTEEIFNKLTSWRFCKQRPIEQENFKAIISNSVKSGQPISLILGHGPSKNLNNCEFSEVDWSELFCLSQLAFLNQKIKEIYKPGLKIRFFLDDLRAESSNGLSIKHTLSYFKSFQELIKKLNLSNFVDEIVSIRDLYRDFNTEKFLPEAENLVKEWELNPENQEQIFTQRKNASRNIPNFEQLNHEQQKEQLEIATHKYRVYHEAEWLSGIWSIKGSLYARFYKHPGVLQLFTIRKGSITQPWQGNGCLLVNQENKLEPFVLTKEKKSRIEAVSEIRINPRELGDYQDLLNLEAFKKIKIIKYS